MSLKRNKFYGALQTDNNINFKGFCKKISSTKTFNIDVFIDSTKIATINANKNYPAISGLYEIYEPEGFCFDYQIPDSFIGKKSLIEFKDERGNNLLNSPTFTLNSETENYNEYLFNYNINKPIKNNEGKGSFTKNVISFMANDINLNNSNFINYIKVLRTILPDTKFKVFYFNEKQKQLFKNCFIEDMEKYDLLIPKNSLDITRETEIFIGLDSYLSKNIIRSLSKNNNHLIIISYPSDSKLLQTSLCKLNSVDNKDYEVLVNAGIKKDSIKISNNKYILAAWHCFFEKNNISYTLNPKITLQNYLKDIVVLVLNNTSCKKHMIHVSTYYYKMHDFFNEN